MSLVIAGHLQIRPGAVPQFVDAAKAVMTGSRAEPGCRAYQFTTDLADPSRFAVFEEWESAEALNAHYGTAHFGTFTAVIAELIDTVPDMTRYVVESSGPLNG